MLFVNGVNNQHWLHSTNWCIGSLKNATFFYISASCLDCCSFFREYVAPSLPREFHKIPKTWVSCFRGSFPTCEISNFSIRSFWRENDFFLKQPETHYPDLISNTQMMINTSSPREMTKIQIQRLTTDITREWCPFILI